MTLTLIFLCASYVFHLPPQTNNSEGIMNERDADYYETHMQEVDLYDVTSSEENATILSWLRSGATENWNRKLYLVSAEIDGDPDEFIIDEDDDMGWLGYLIGKSKELEELHINYLPEGKERVDAFMEGIICNQSIREVYIRTDLGDAILKLGDLLRKSDTIKIFTVVGDAIGKKCAHNIALMLGEGQCKSLKSLGFLQNRFGDEGFSEIISSLSVQSQLEGLKVCGSNVGRDGWAQLGLALKDINLKKLHLCHNDIDDEGLHALVTGLKKGSSVEYLVLAGNASITAEGLKSLSSLLQSDNCLEVLDLGDMNIGNDGLDALMDGLAKNKYLKLLSLSGNSIDDTGLAALASRRSNLESLSLSENSAFTAAGLRSLSNAFQVSRNLEHLNLRDNAIDDEGLRALVDGMTNCCSLRRLDLSCNESVTAAGLKYLLQAENCRLKTLELWGTKIGDDKAVAIADGLVGNKSMEGIYFCPHSSDISEVGWSAFSKLLFDTSSINNTYLSNHVIQNIGGYESHGAGEMNRFHLHLNSCNDDVAMSKILMHHQDFDMMPFFRWKLRCFPLIVSWFEKASSCWEEIHSSVCSESILGCEEMSALHRFFTEESDAYQSKRLSAVYKFVRGMPMLVVGEEVDDGS